MLVQLGFRYAQGYRQAKVMSAQSVMDWVNRYEGFTEWQQVHCSMVDKSLIFASIEHCHWFHMLQPYGRPYSQQYTWAKSFFVSVWRVDEKRWKTYRNTEALSFLESLHEQIHTKAQIIVSHKTDEETQPKTLEEIDNLHRSILNIYHALNNLFIIYRGIHFHHKSHYLLKIWQVAMLPPKGMNFPNLTHKLNCFAYCVCFDIARKVENSIWGILNSLSGNFTPKSTYSHLSIYKDTQTCAKSHLCVWNQEHQIKFTLNKFFLHHCHSTFYKRSS